MYSGVSKVNNNQLPEEEHLAFLSGVVKPMWKQVVWRMQSI
jgi:hypothetical protein